MTPPHPNPHTPQPPTQFGQAAGGGPIDRVSKVLSHAFKPRVGGHKGQDVGGPWVHKALGSDDPIERPTLLAGEEPQPQPAEVEPLVAPATATDSTPKRADAVLHLGGGLRQGQVGRWMGAGVG